MPLSTGQTIHNRYRVVKLLGQGGFGAVYRAWDLSLKQPCAVKENLETSPEARRQFEREATILASMRHPNLPRVIDYFFLPEQGQYLVMDFVEGNNLVQAVERNGGPLPESQALEWVRQVCSALNYLHSQKPAVIHRDIKPQNIIVTPSGQVILVDFGISKIFDPALSTTGGARGVTPGFSPPEQYGRARTDPRSDLYALAATLYFLLTTHEPPDAIERMVHNTPITPPSQHNPAISPAVEQAILRSLETDSQRRFADTTEFLQALSNQDETPPSVQLHQPFPISAPGSAPSPAPSSVPQHGGKAQPEAPMLASAGMRPRLVNVAAFYCITFGIASMWLIGRFINFISLLSLVALLLSIVGGGLMLRGKEAGRRICVALLGVYAVSIALVAGFAGLFGQFLIVAALFLIPVTLYLFFNLQRTKILDFFLPHTAPHQHNPAKTLQIAGWLYIALGFWLLAPILAGIGMLVRKSRNYWRLAIAGVSISWLISFLAFLYNASIVSRTTGIAILALVLHTCAWLYLRRPETRQTYP